MHGTYQKLHSDQGSSVAPTNGETPMSRDAQDALLSVAQAASLLGVHPNTVRSWTDAGRLTAYRINSRGDRRFRRSEVERILVEDAPADIEPAPGDRPVRAEELAIFERLATGMATTPSPGGVARALEEAMRTEWHAERAAVYVATEATFELVAHAGFDLPPPSSSPVEEEPMASDGPNRVLRLTARSGLVGALVLDAPSVDRMSPPFVRAIVSSVATPLASARLLGRARREVRRARALRSVTKELTGTLDLSSVLGEVVELTRSLFEADKAGLWLIGKGEHPFSIAAQHGLGEEFLAQVST